MKEEKKSTIPWEAKDPALPAFNCTAPGSRREERKVNENPTPEV